jgi:hypothetical protein
LFCVSSRSGGAALRQEAGVEALTPFARKFLDIPSLYGTHLTAMQTMQKRNAERGSPNVEAGAARGYYGEPKLMNSERGVEWRNLRLNSLMFAYVRLCSLNGRKIFAGAARGHLGPVQNRPIPDCRLQIADGGTGKPQRAQWAQSIRGCSWGWGSNRGFWNMLWARELSNLSL